MLDGSEVVEVLEVDAVKATTLFADEASSRPSPTLGVEKWLAGSPIEANPSHAGNRKFAVSLEPLSLLS